MREEIREVEKRIEADYPDFNPERMYEYSKRQLKSFYENAITLPKEKLEEKYPKLSNLDNILSSKKEFRLDKNIDRFAVQHLSAYEYLPEEKEIHLLVSVTAFDDTNNNENEFGDGVRYWSDTWIVTYKRGSLINEQNICRRCGATLKYDDLAKVLKCDYCRNEIPCDSDIDWILTKIEVDNEILY